jgi:8-oxo-dGTP diphosphatase
MDGKLRNMAGIYITDNDKMLLLYRVGSKVVQPSWCNVGGHFESSELNDAKACALREVFEEAGITESDLGKVALRYVTLRLKNNEIRQNYYFFAELLNKDLQLMHCDEGTLEWVEFSRILEREMPFTAKRILQHYLSVGIHDHKIYAGTATDEQVVFHVLNEF